MTSDYCVVLDLRAPDRVGTRLARSVLRQSSPPAEVVVIHPDPGAAATKLGLEALTTIPLPTSFSAPLGSALARAVRSSAAGLLAVLAGDERLHEGFFRAVTELMSDSEISLATSARVGGPFGVERTSAVDLPGVLADPWSLPTATVWRRGAWTDATGPGTARRTELGDLVLWDLWIRAITDGGRIATSDEPLIAWEEGDEVAFVRASSRPYLADARRIERWHRQQFETHADRVLVERERRNRSWWTVERRLTDERVVQLRELAALESELERLDAELRDAGREVLEWSDLRRPEPISRWWGLDRGTPVDRWYIERFVDGHADDVRGRVLELLDPGLTERFGGVRVTRSDVLDIDPTNRRATVVGDLRHLADLPDGIYDCVLLTQTLHLVDDMEAVVRSLHRVLRPGGVLLVTVPSLSMSAVEYGEVGDCWRLTPAGAGWLFRKVFPADAVEVGAKGNVLAGTAFLTGLALEEMRPEELEVDDPAYPTIVTVRAVKPGSPAVARRPSPRAAILLWHRISEVATDVHRLAVPPDRFDDQLEALTARWNVLPLDDLIDGVETGELPERAVALTFDDATSDHLDLVAPRLEALGLHGTFYATTEPLDRSLVPWWDWLERAVMLSDGLPAEVVLDRNGELVTVELGDRRSGHDRLYELIKPLGPASRAWAVRSLRSALPIAPGEPASLLDRDGLLALEGSIAATIGCHTVHHLALPCLEPVDRARQLIDSRAALERLLGQTVTSFAHPYGEVSPETLGLARRLGFETAVTCEPRGLQAGDDRWALPRLDVADHSATSLLRCLDDLDGDGTSAFAGELD